MIVNSVDEDKNIGDEAVDRKTEQGVSADESPLDAFRRSAGFQIAFVLHSGLHPHRAVDHLCASAEKFAAALRAWQPIETAPVNQSVLIFIPSPTAEHYGPAIYRGLLKESIGTRIWMVTGLHFGSDVLLDEYKPTHWMPLPDPPEVKE